jgi:3-deoxy-D-manno-octulosonic-acid transferase
MTLALYRWSTELVWPLGRIALWRRQRAGKEDASRFQERLGIAAYPRPAAPLVWLHGASIGESLALLPLIERIGERYPKARVLVTSGTVTSARLLGERLPAGAIHQFVPLDRRRFVVRFLDHWRPDAAIWSESDFWPNLISETAARGVPLALVNGRLSERSFAAWQRWAPSLIRATLNRFSLSLGQTSADAQRLAALSGQPCASVGNLKFASPPLPVDCAERARLAAAVADRPRWLAASTHPGEEMIAADVHRALAPAHPGLLTLIVPRHPGRGTEITAALRAAGHRVAQRSAGEPISDDIGIYVADTLGELGLMYRLADIVFIGKSLVGAGGQNPIEPAALGAALVFGPQMANFADIARTLLVEGAARQAASAGELAQAVGDLLADGTQRAERIAAGLRVAESQAHVLDAVWLRILPLLDRALNKGATR